MDFKEFDYEEVDMHSKNVTDVQNIIKTIENNPAVKRINLSDNYITTLPKDLSTLPEVEEMNLIDNDLNPFEDAVVALSTMPKLFSLHLNLHEESQVDFVIKNLPNLTHLNGEMIDRDELQDGTSQEEFVDSAPQHQSERSIKQINEAEEKEEDDLSEKKYDTKQTQEEQKEQEDNNSSYSGSCGGGLNYSDSEEISLKPGDLETIALIFDRIRGMHRKSKISNDKQMASDFDKHLKT